MNPETPAVSAPRSNAVAKECAKVTIRKRGRATLLSVISDGHDTEGWRRVGVRNNRFLEPRLAIRSTCGLALHWGMSGNKARTRALLLVIAALGTIGCDRVTKSAASAYLAGIPDRSFLSDTIRVGYVENTGGFLSVGADLPPIARDAVFTGATGIVLITLLGLTLQRKYTGAAEFGLVLFIAGGASNWIDRVLRGSVVDFLNLGIGALRTGVFNIADVAIMIGAGLFVLGELGWSWNSGISPTPEHPVSRVPDR